VTVTLTFNNIESELRSTMQTTVFPSSLEIKLPSLLTLPTLALELV